MLSFFDRFRVQLGLVFSDWLQSALSAVDLFCPLTTSILIGLFLLRRPKIEIICFGRSFLRVLVIFDWSVGVTMVDRLELVMVDRWGRASGGGWLLMLVFRCFLWPSTV